ncbi:AbrB/MazE/SpoVT family DNA-binding domain-containing protein [Lactobacillus amylovorus]|jgi:antitoxin PrlF|uniref:AbrB/MazE/SpoVT family DNA-binding domain-containing protein n=1 Tax=Lactobacillus amylovorus TaxID=1604 RepID=UPI000E4BE9D0|nr:AbrB/MazE/SpoVT family DNA-binding domain-containing protein [Lactobacillus amylovorus]MCT3600381.1 AbrB family transcriptional regulator [Lactobacillus amylovorus]MDB6253104.1 AbrB/MazE/SpoVT family DNA-binding domain-containing protein [Lactobacillus amylovorus]RGW83708.1 AbrB family transcriptional regulator [Lactobacillus amylovorus]
MQVSAKITSKNQITLPKVLRDKLELGDSDKTIVFNISDNKPVTVEKPKTNNLWDIVEEQRKKYGSIDTPEIDWGLDVGEERLD